MKSEWSVSLTRKAQKGKKNLPKNAHRAFLHLLMELKEGPEKPHWANYSKLGSMSYHCHLKKGKPTFVACWRADKKKKTIEVYYAGTHENAPY